MKFYENIEAERERIQKCISRFGWTSDHNLDWYSCCMDNKDGKPVFIEFDDGTGLLTYKYFSEWSIWSDPLCDKDLGADKISEFAEFLLSDQIKEIWCVDVSDSIRPALIKKSTLSVDDIYYSLLWPVMDITSYNPLLPGGHFKDIRNAKSKFYREHKIEILEPKNVAKEDLIKIVDDWKKKVIKKQKEDVYDLKYRNAIENNFRGFLTSRVILADGRPIGFNAGYEVVNSPGRFAGVVGIHDYSINDLGLILWLEDLEWIKNAGYKELDMQGDEDGGGLRFKMQFNPVIERKTNTFSICRQ